jgi:5-methylcytosine-specific restriction endonuclease McrA
MNSVFVLSNMFKPLMPTRPARANRLLKAGKAVVYRLQPFTIILKHRSNGITQPIELKVDPGSKTTGIALVGNKTVLWAANLSHRGHIIKVRLDKRRTLRHKRRGRKTRYRPARWLNRSSNSRKGIKQPSLLSRINNIKVWQERLTRYTPITSIAVEINRFDTQKIQDPEISGVEYQQGELLGYEIREYLLEKFNRTCVYCGKKNLKKSLKDAAIMNAIRYIVGNILKDSGLPTTCWSGGRTKKNRVSQGYRKDHWIDAACIGETGENVSLVDKSVLNIKAMGRGRRQVVRVDKYGFPRGKPGCIKRVYGFQTGDLVKLTQPKGKYIGIYFGRLGGIRTRGYFDIKTTVGKITSNYKNFKILQRNDGYEYFVV